MLRVTIDTSVDCEPLRIEICPNCSLSVRGAQVFFAGACVVPCGVGAFLAMKGFWPILPFAGLEMALLGWALKLSLERRFHRQTITVTDADVSIESRLRERCSRVVFPRHCAQVKLRRPAAQQHPSRLTIEPHARQCELWSLLAEQEAPGLGRRLLPPIGPVQHP